MSAYTELATPLVPRKLTRRGTTNRNRRGSADDRRRRREWLVDTFRSDRDLIVVTEGVAGSYQFPIPAGYTEAEAFERWVLIEERDSASLHKTCRCYRCGVLLIVDTVSPDRIIPGCEGGTYRRGNIRPSCEPCQSTTGGHLGNARKRARS